MPPKRSLQDVLGKIPPSPAPKMSKPRATAKPKATPKVPAIITTAPPNTALASAAAPLTTEVDYDFHIVDRKHYPPVLSNTRVSEYLSGARIKPIDALLSTLPSPPIPPSRSVLYWFRTDLRLEDNTALHQASTFSAANSIPLIALYVFSPSDFDAHLTSPARIDFILRNLSVLRENLSRLNIPLWIEAVDERAEIPARVLQLAQDWGAAHIWANMEYEVDELRRDTKVVLNGRGLGMAVNIVHDTCVVPPGLLTAKSSGKAFAVYSPFYKAFLVRLGEEPGLLTLHPAPGPNPESARKDYARLFGCPLPATPATKLLTPKEAAVQLQLFPAGEQEVHRRLTTFLDEKAAAYSTDRNFPGKPGTAMLSAYLAAGALSARTAVVRAQQKNGGKLKGGREGLDVWISEVAWRDFYRHILVANPHIWCILLPP